MRIQNVAFLSLVLATSVSATHELGWKAPQSDSAQFQLVDLKVEDSLICVIDIQCGDFNASLKIIQTDDEHTKLVLTTPTDREVMKPLKSSDDPVTLQFDCDGNATALTLTPSGTWGEVESCMDLIY